MTTSSPTPDDARESAMDPPAGSVPVDDDAIALTDDLDPDPQDIEDAEGAREHAPLPTDDELPD